MDFYPVVKALHEQDALFTEQQSRYAAIAAASRPLRASSSSVASKPVETSIAPSAPIVAETTKSPPVDRPGPSTAPAVVFNDILSSVARLSAAAPTRMEAAIPEHTNDPRLFRLRVLADPWNSVTSGKPFFAKLPDFSCDSARSVGYNCLIIRGEYMTLEPTSEKFFLSVDVSDTTKVGERILCHFAARADVRGATGMVIRKIVQGYKSGATSAWDTDQKQYKDDGEFPLRPRNSFWLRIVMNNFGCFSYIDGKLIQFYPFISGQPPPEFSDLYVNLATMGGAGERSSWKVEGMWWGIYNVPPADAAIAEAKLKNKRMPVLQWAPNEIRLVGDLSSVHPTQVSEAFSRYGVSDVRIETDGYHVMLSDPGELANIDREVREVKGHPIRIARVLKPVVPAFTSSIVSGVGFSQFTPSPAS